MKTFRVKSKHHPHHGTCTPHKHHYAIEWDNGEKQTCLDLSYIHAEKVIDPIPSRVPQNKYS